MLSTDLRRQLGAFLRARREALSPELIGRFASQRRRTPGLRREEVAELSGLSTTWYTWVEQGRDISLSTGALTRLAEALRLSPAERAYLFELARRRDPSPHAPDRERETVPGELSDLLDAVTAPAYLLDRLYRGQGWNAAARRLFSPWVESGEQNLLRYVFLDPGAQTFICDWENRARRLLAEFRADSVQDATDAEVSALVQDLRRESAAFARFWESQTVLAREGGARSFSHPRDGVLRYEQTTLLPAAHPGLKLVILLPAG